MWKRYARIFSWPPIPTQLCFFLFEMFFLILRCFAFSSPCYNAGSTYIQLAVHSSPTYQLAWLWGAQWRVIAHYSSAFKVMIKTRQIAIAVSGISKLFFNFVKWAIEKLVKLQRYVATFFECVKRVKKTRVKYKQWYLTIFFIQRANSLVWLN